MDRDKVITFTKEWLDLWNILFDIGRSAQPNGGWVGSEWQQEELQTAFDLLCPVTSLAYLRARSALIAYTKEREAEYAAHDRMLETIEQTLQKEINNGV